MRFGMTQRRRHVEKRPVSPARRQIGGHADRLTDRQTDRQADRQAGRQTDRQTDRQIYCQLDRWSVSHPD